MAVLQGYIVAMAFSRKNVIKMIDSIQDEIIEHLVKIAIYDNTDRNNLIHHWQSEILAWLSKIDNKANNTKNGSLKLTDYKKCLDRDMTTAHRIGKFIRSAKLELYGCVAWKELTNEALFDDIYSILLAQYEAMSKDEWIPETMTDNALYKAISQ